MENKQISVASTFILVHVKPSIQSLSLHTEQANNHEHIKSKRSALKMTS